MDNSICVYVAKQYIGMFATLLENISVDMSTTPLSPLNVEPMVCTSAGTT